MKERRKHERVSVSPANLRLTMPQPYQLASIIDLSLGGVGVEIEGTPPKPGDLVDVTLHLPAGDKKFDAIVRHVHKLDGEQRFQIGCEFDDPNLIEAFAGDWIAQQLEQKKDKES